MFVYYSRRNVFKFSQFKGCQVEIAISDNADAFCTANNKLFFVYCVCLCVQTI